MPQPQPLAETTQEQEPTPVASAAVANGVIGGTSGGVTGGIIGAHRTEALPVSQVANPPLLLSRVMPEYPRSARLQGVEGLVLLEAILDMEGRIEDDIKVLQSIPSLDFAAMQALRRWRFRPARDRENRPVRVILEVPVRFVLR
jgi:protein TonB